MLWLDFIRLRGCQQYGGDLSCRGRVWLGSVWVKGRLALYAAHAPEAAGRPAELCIKSKSGVVSNLEREQLLFTDFTVSWITARGFGLGFGVFWREESRIPRKIRKKITVKTVADLKQQFLIIVIFYTL